MLDEHDVLVRGAIRAHGGVMYKHTGDGVCAWFTEPVDAVPRSCSMLAAFEDPPTSAPAAIGSPFASGSLAGRPIFRDGDLFARHPGRGGPRLCAAAAPGTGLATAEVQAGMAQALPSGGERMLKGFDRSMATYLPSRYESRVI